MYKIKHNLYTIVSFFVNNFIQMPVFDHKALRFFIKIVFGGEMVKIAEAISDMNIGGAGRLLVERL